MKTADKKYLKKIRKNIMDLSKIQDFLYKQCLEKFNVKDEDSWLVDYLYGNVDNIEKVEKHVIK